MVLGLWWILGCSGEVKPVEEGAGVEKGFKEYESEFYSGGKEVKMRLLDELEFLGHGEFVMILIRGIFDEDEEVRARSLEVFESYRRYALVDLDRNFYGHVDGWIRKYKGSILKQLGLTGEYEKFLEEIEEEGGRSYFYREEPLRYLIDSGEVYRVTRGLKGMGDEVVVSRGEGVSVEEGVSKEGEGEGIFKRNGLRAFWMLWVMGEFGLEGEVEYVFDFLSVELEGVEGGSKGCVRYELSKSFSVVWAMMKMREKGWNGLLAKGLFSKNKYVQEVSALAIGELQDERFKGLFLELLGMQSEKITDHLRAGILWSLGQLGEKRVLSRIGRMKRKEEEFYWAKIQEYWILKRFNFIRVPLFVLEGLDDDRIAMKEAALLMIDQLDDRTKVKELHGLIRDILKREKELILQESREGSDFNGEEKKEREKIRKESIILLKKVLLILSKWELDISVDEILPLLSIERFRNIGIIALGDIGWNGNGKVSQYLLKLLFEEDVGGESKVLIVESLLKLRNKEIYPSLLDELVIFYEGVWAGDDEKSEFRNEDDEGAEEKSKKKGGKKKKKEKEYDLKQEIVPFWKVLNQLANLEKLKLFLGQDFSKSFQLEVMRAIGQIEEIEEIKELDFLDELLKSKDQRLRVEAVKLAGLFKYGKTNQLLLNFIQKGGDQDLVEGSILSLGKLRKRLGMERVIDLTRSTDEKINLAANKSLGYSGYERAYEVLVENYGRSRGVKEKVNLLLTMMLLGELSLEYRNDLLEILKEPIYEDIKPFMKEYIEEMGFKKGKEFIEAILLELNPVDRLWFAGYINDLRVRNMRVKDLKVKKEEWKEEVREEGIWGGGV